MLSFDVCALVIYTTVNDTTPVIKIKPCYYFFAPQIPSSLYSKILSKEVYKMEVNKNHLILRDLSPHPEKDKK